MSEALEWAADYAERNKIFEAPTNSRGYTIDGWKGIEPAERARVITDLARTVVDSEEVVRVDSPDIEAVKAIRKNLAEVVDNPKYMSAEARSNAYANTMRQSITDLDAIVRSSEGKS